jgi:SAM-dependent methyltransferase
VLWNNPIGEQKFDQIALALELSPGNRVLEIGCGTGEMLIRLVERYGIQAIGIDSSEEAIQEARRSAILRTSDADLEWMVVDAKSWHVEPESFDLALCIGSTHAFGLGAGAFERAIRNIAPLVRHGGKLLLGDGFMTAPADSEYRKILGDFPSDETTHYGNIAAARDNGLVPLSAWVSSEDEWDEFEWSHQRLAEQSAANKPDDVQACEKLKRRRQWMDAYLRWGRITLGFGVYLLRKPDA